MFSACTETSEFFEIVESLFHDWNGVNQQLIYSLIKSIKPKVVVEIGTYRGYSACYIARALQENDYGILYCIDDFSLRDHVIQYGDPIEHLASNLTRCGVKQWTKLIIGKSDEVEWPAKIDFAFIDGWHGYRAVEHDFNKAVKLGATTIILDDTISTVGPRQFVYELRQNNTDWDILELHEGTGLTICYKRQARRRVEFCQEFYDNDGVYLREMTDKDLIDKVKEATKVTEKEYDIDNLFPGRPQPVEHPDFI